MGLKFTKIPNNTFERLQINAGIIVDSFDPSTGVYGNIIGATTGGITFSSNPSYEDYGEDVDNCPNNMLELKRLTAFDPQMSGTFLTCNPSMLKSLIGGADIDNDDDTHVVPREVLLATDFDEVWWIGDYSDVNTGDNAGFLAIHLMNALNQAGFQITTTKNGKGQMAFEYHGHYSINSQDTVPFEIYCKTSEGTVNPYVQLNKHSVHVTNGDTATLIADVHPDGQSVTWASSSTTYATVADGVVTAKAVGSAIITASITVDGVTYNDTCTVIVDAAT